VTYGGRVPARSLASLAALVAALCLAQAASAKQVTVQRGWVTATLSYSAGDAGFGYTFDGLKIVRAGKALYDDVPAPVACRQFGCGPTVGFKAIPPLRVRDLDADGEPEVLLTAFSGGAHCCIVAQIFQLKPDASGYSAMDRDFGNGGFELRDLNRDGRPEFVSDDDAFAYRFTAYAFSGRPIVISLYDHGKYVNVTERFPRLVRRNARFFWRGYLSLRRNRDDSPRGQISAWAADQYRLGKRAYALRVLRREARRGFLGSSPARRQRFIQVLDQFLRTRGYA
jgi:hypothetical protein